MISEQNEQLKHLLSEKDWLLKEVHHRVKNNLHTVICLLESQAAYLNNDALRAIQQSQHRIYAMSLIHQKLYQSDDVRMINMEQYLRQFIEYLSDCFDVSEQIHFRLNLEKISLNVSQAIPIALIINEAVTNSIKYAFPDNRRGEIIISLVTTWDKMIQLVISDNGIGMDPELNVHQSNSLGLQLIRGLAKEIKSDIEFERVNGTQITIMFKHDELFEHNHYTSRLISQEART